jgi:hypothetical protein
LKSRPHSPGVGAACACSSEWLVAVALERQVRPGQRTTCTVTHAPTATQRVCDASCRSSESVVSSQSLALWGCTPAVKNRGKSCRRQQQQPRW